MKKFMLVFLASVLAAQLWLPFCREGAGPNGGGTVFAEEGADFAVSDYLYADFETSETSGSAIYSAEKTWVSEGFGGSRGAVKVKNNANNMGGVQINGNRSVVGETYEISILAKPPADKPDALDGAYVVAYYRYMTEEESGGGPVPSENFSGYHLIYLTNKEDVGGGWYRYYKTYTVSGTCTVSSSKTAQIYGETCNFQYRAKAADIEYMLDEFICSPVYSAPVDEPVVLNADFDSNNPAYTLMDGTSVEIKDDGGADETQNYLYIASSHAYSSIKYSNLDVTPATAYKLTWYAKIGKPEDAGKYYLRAYMDYSGADSAELGNYLKINVDKPLTDQWQKFECVFRASKNAENYIVNALNKRPTFYFRMSGQGSGYTQAIADYCVDQFKIERMGVPYGGTFDEGFGIQAVYDGTTKVPAWSAGSGATVFDATEGENAYIEVTQAANSGADGRIGQNIYLKPEVKYMLQFRAKSDRAGTSLTPAISVSDGEQETENALPSVQLQSEWTDFEIPFTLDTVPSTCLLAFSLLNGKNAEEMRYCLDNVKIVQPGLSNARVSGDFSTGSTLAASFDNGLETFAEYRVMTSSDGVHFAKLAGGKADGNVASYTITESDAGNFLRFDFFAVSGGEVSNLVSTRPQQVTGTRVYFTTEDFDEAETLTAKAVIKDSALKDETVTLIMAVYGRKNALLNVESRKLSSDEIMSGEAEISLPKPEGAMRAKAFLWEDFDTVKPLTEAQEIAAGLSLEQIVDTLQMKAVTKIPGYEVISSIDTGYDDVSAILFDGLPYKGEETQVFAYMGIPKDASAENQVPAVVLIHGNASRLYPSWVKTWVDKGYAAIACYMMDRNTELDPNVSYNQGPRQPSGYYTDIEEPLEDQYMYHAVASAILAKNLLASLPEVQADAVGITGISNGGMITSYAIGVDPGFAFAVPVYNSGYLNEGGVNKGLSGKRLLWDAKNVLPDVQMPTLFINGHAANMYAIDQNTKSALAVKDSVISYKYGLGHSQPAGEVIPEIFAFADSVVRGGPKFTNVGRVTVTDGTASFSYETENTVSKIRLIYNTSGIQYSGSTSATNWAQPVEVSVPADNTVSFTLPTGTKGFYFELTDDACGIVSTEYVELSA